MTDRQSGPLILTLDCADRPGITAQVTGFLFERGCNILDAQQFRDSTSDRFFMRVAFDPTGISSDAMREAFGTFAQSFACLLYTSPSPRDQRGSRMPSSA